MAFHNIPNRFWVEFEKMIFLQMLKAHRIGNLFYFLFSENSSVKTFEMDHCTKKFCNIIVISSSFCELVFAHSSEVLWNTPFISNIYDASLMTYSFDGVICYSSQTEVAYNKTI